jgi:hypothetical protein
VTAASAAVRETAAQRGPDGLAVAFAQFGERIEDQMLLAKNRHFRD